MDMLDIDIQDRQVVLDLDPSRFMRAIEKVALDYGYHTGEVSLILVDDPTIHTINREHLQHDYPTDVISFLFTGEAGVLEGELIVSTDTAQREAVVGGWGAADEVLLYVIHGTLHLVGLDDQDAVSRQQMRREEAKYLAYSQIAAAQIEAMSADKDDAS
jgi:probable rRNA maturation factor